MNDGRTEGAASTRGRKAAWTGKAASRVRLPDKVTIACPAGTRDRIEAAAERDGMTPADWHRRLVRRGVEASERADRRRKAGGK